MTHSVVLASFFGEEFDKLWDHLLNQAQVSWDHHDTLRYIAVGGALLFFVWIGYRREWNFFLLAVAGVAGTMCIAAGLFYWLLGDYVRKTGRASSDTIAREIRMSHGGPGSYVALGGVCRGGPDCGSGAACLKVKGDDTLRCYLKCPEEGCPTGQSCQKIGHVSVCR
jgi:hypothetical protein